MLRSFLNINHYIDYNVYDRDGEPLAHPSLSAILSPSLASMELSREKYIDIPEEVLSVYSSFRPTPLFRATDFEEALGCDCRIYIKDEGVAPAGSHKSNSAYYIASACKRDGLKTLTTETTGNWGVALAGAAKDIGIELVCFIDAESNIKRKDRKKDMEAVGAKVIIVEPTGNYKDLITLSSDVAIAYTHTIDNAAYIFGSVYGYFLVPQTLIGLEAKIQMQELSCYPDIVVGSCGGGANLMGIASAFLADRLEHGRNVEIFSAEAASCPILTKGKMGIFGIDQHGFYPQLNTYGIDGLINNGDYIGGLGSTIVASSVAYFHSQGLIGAGVFTAEEARMAANLFYKSTGRRVALETSYQLAGLIHLCKKNAGKSFLVAISSIAEPL